MLFIKYAVFFALILTSCNQPTILPAQIPTLPPTQTTVPPSIPSPTLPPSPTLIPTRAPGMLLPVRCLYVSFDKRGYPSGYYSGDVISNFNEYDPVVGHTIKEEVALQLDEIAKLGVNSIAYELRSSDPIYLPGTFAPPDCNISPALGLQYPQPTQLETNNLVEFLNLLESKGMTVFLRLVNTHMEEQPPVNNEVWLGTILKAIKGHPALNLVLFEGNLHTIDTNQDGKGDICGIPAEPSLWEGPDSVSSEYIKWAITYAHSLGLPYQVLSAEAVVGDFSATKPEETGYWNTVLTLKEIFDAVGVPEEQRTYAISIYERPKCAYSRITCDEEQPHLWAMKTFEYMFETIGYDTKAKIVIPEMGLMTNIVHSSEDSYYYEPIKYGQWSKELALESLVWLMQAYGIDGGCFWAWSNMSSMEEVDPVYSLQVKRRGTEFSYTPLKDVMENLYKFGQTQQPDLTPETTPPTFHDLKVEPAIVENGQPIQITAMMDEPFIFVLADISKLDSSQHDPVTLIDNGDGLYRVTTTISLWNDTDNGKKTIPMWAMDFWGNVAETTLEVELGNPNSAQDTKLPNDHFDGKMIDAGKWQIALNGGKITVDDRVRMSIPDDAGIPNPTLQSKWVFAGDFDTQIDFEIGEGWGKPEKEHIDGATFGVAINGETYHITRLRDQNENTIFTWSNQGTLSGKSYTEALSGQYRLIRKSDMLYLLFDVGQGWTELAHVKVPTDPAQIYIAIASINASHSFTTYFDNFAINSGQTNYYP